MLALFFATSLHAEYVFDANCQSAYKAAWALKHADANDYLSLERKTHPNNLIPIHIANLVQFVEIFASEERKEYQKFKDDKDNRVSALSKDTKGPWYPYCKAEIYLQSAVLKLKFTDYLSAAYDFNKAYHILTSCTEEYPDFLPAQKDLLLLKAVVGTVPVNYRWMLKILGFNGDLKSSMAKYEALIPHLEQSRDYSIFTNESRIIYAYLSFYMLNKPIEAWRIMDIATRDYKTNPIDAFVRSNLALRLKKNDIAIESLTSQVQNEPAVPYLDYLMGIARMQRGDKSAGFYFGRYIKEYKGEHYIKDAYLKLGWSFLLLGDDKHYKSAIDLVSVYGTAQIEEDKNAQREAETSKYTVPAILRARLSLDGGYLNEAEAEIKNVNPLYLSFEVQKSEYYYRYARIEDAIGRSNIALINYQIVIDKYSDQKNYYAPASCLYTGMIWERLKDNNKAASSYKKCINYHGYIYKDSFDQKAYAGLKRTE